MRAATAVQWGTGGDRGTHDSGCARGSRWFCTIDSAGAFRLHDDGREQVAVPPHGRALPFRYGIDISEPIVIQARSTFDMPTAARRPLHGAVSQACTLDLTGQDLGGKTLTPGVYCFSSSAQLTGILALNAGGNAGAVFIFKIGSTLTTASGSSPTVINGGSPCNVFWQVGSSATAGTTTSFAGNILALTSITLTTGARVTGRALARNGAVTLDSNTVTTAVCAAAPVPALPDMLLVVLALGLIALGYFRLRRQARTA